MRHMTKPLFIVPDKTYDPPKRYMVKDEKENVLFITHLDDNYPEQTAVKWAIKQGGWLVGLIKGGNIISNLNPFEEEAILKLDLGKPLYIVTDPTHNPPRRLMVVDEDKNVLFFTDLHDNETEQTATHAAMKLGGWLKGAVKLLQQEK